MKLSQMIGDFLSKKGHDVTYFSLPVDKSKSFLRNVFDSLFSRKLEFDIPDISQYHTLFLGCPVWAFNIVPAMESFIEKADFSNKDVFLFITYGSGAGKHRAVRRFINLVREKGGNVKDYFLIKGKDIEKGFEKIKGKLERINT